MKKIEKIIVTQENKHKYILLEECGDIEILSGVKIEIPALTTSGYIYLHENAKASFPILTKSENIDLHANAEASFPALTTSGYIYLHENAKASFPALTTSGSIDLHENAEASFPALTTSGYIDLHANAEASFPALTTSGSIDLHENAEASFPALTTSGYIDLHANAEASFPALTTSGSIDLHENAEASFPALTTSGYIDLHANAEASFPALTTSGYIYLGKNAKFIHAKINNYISVDNYLFIKENEHKKKDIVIFKGYNLINFINNELIKEFCYVAKKDNYTAHGKTIKKAIEDLNFKILTEKINKEPINADTEMTVEKYRLITGACELGCKNWMDANNIPFLTKNGHIIETKSILAKELLPLLERTNAWGLEKIKSLLTF